MTVGTNNVRLITVSFFEMLSIPSVPGKLKIMRSILQTKDLTRGENETGCRRRDVDDKELSTTGVTLSRSGSNESDKLFVRPRGREITGHLAYYPQAARLGL